MIGTSELYILIPVSVTMTFIKGHSCMRNQKLLRSFSCKFLSWFRWNVVCCQNCWFVEAHDKFSRHNSYSKKTDISTGRILWNVSLTLTCVRTLVYYICFKLDVMLDTTKLFTFIPVYTLSFSQGHRFMGNLETVQSFCCRVAWSNPNICDDCNYYVRELSSKKSSRYCKYEPFEHLQFFLSDSYELCLHKEYLKEDYLHLYWASSPICLNTDSWAVPSYQVAHDI